MAVIVTFDRVGRPAAVIAVLLAWLLPALAAADARDRYKDGVDALKEGRFPAAEQAFRDAIAERAEERVGTFRRDYLPHFQLGVALEEQNRCREALASWAESQRQGEIEKAAAENAELRRRTQRCEEKVRELDAARAAAEQAVARAREAALAMKRLQAKPELAAVWNDGEPSFAGRQQDVLQRTGEAERRLGAIADSHGVRPLQEVKMLANQVVGEIEAFVADAEARLRSIQDAASSALDRLQAVEQRATDELGAVAYLQPYPPELGRRVEELRQTLQAVAADKRSASPQALAALQARLEDDLSRLQQAAAPPPAGLRTAVKAFLSGDYESVLATLEGERYRDPRAAGQACLLRAAARHAFWVLSGETEDELLAALLTDVEECRRLRPPPPIPARFFSPRFLRFYENPPPPEGDAEAVEGEAAPPAG